jgi:hypothetical protein
MTLAHGIPTYEDDGEATGIRRRFEEIRFYE